MTRKINLGIYEDETRKMTIQYAEDSFYIMHQDYESLEEYAVEYSFDAFIKTFKFMDKFFTELVLNDKEVAKKLFGTVKIKSKIQYGNV